MKHSHAPHSLRNPDPASPPHDPPRRPHVHSPYDPCPPEKAFVVKISCSSSDLLAHLQTVARVASTRSAVQALSGVQVAAPEGGVELRATDMEVGLRVPLEATVEREGIVVLPARLMLDLARQLPGDDVSLELRPAEQDV